MNNFKTLVSWERFTWWEACGAQHGNYLFMTPECELALSEYRKGGGAEPALVLVLGVVQGTVRSYQSRGIPVTDYDVQRTNVINPALPQPLRALLEAAHAKVLSKVAEMLPGYRALLFPQSAPAQ